MKYEGLFDNVGDNVSRFYFIGKLTPDQVKSGYSSLKTIASLLNLNDSSDGAVAPAAQLDMTALTDACNQFYTKIPHAFGYTVYCTEQI